MSELSDLSKYLNLPDDPGYQDRVLSSAGSVVDSLLEKAPEIDRRNLLRIEELPLEEQASIFHKVVSATPESEKLFLELSTARKLLNGRYKNRSDPFFIDPLIDLVERDHKVVVVYEEPQGGVSRSWARFIERVVSDGGVISVDATNPDIQKLGINLDTAGTGLFRTPPQVEGVSSDAPSEAQSLQGLFELYLKDRNNPAFETGSAAEEAARRMITDKYKLRMATGIVTKPSRPDTGETLVLDDGTEINQTDVRFIAIVGINESTFLQRGDEEPYLHRMVRVWVDGRWIRGRIAEYAPEILGIRCEEMIAEPEAYLGGRGLSIGPNSDSIDYSDPYGPEKKHILESYPHIKHNVCVRYKNRFGETVYGYIYSVTPSAFRVDGERGDWDMIPFDGEYEIIDTPDSNPVNEWLRAGNRFKVIDPERGIDVIFEIKGYDRSADRLIGAWVNSVRPRWNSTVQVFPRMEVELLGSPKEILERYPYLKKKFYNGGGHPNEGKF